MPGSTKAHRRRLAAFVPFWIILVVAEACGSTDPIPFPRPGLEDASPPEASGDVRPR